MSVFGKLKFFVVDWWQSAGERRTIDDSMRAVRESSHMNRSIGGRVNNEQHGTDLAAEANERYLRSFEKD